MESIDLDIIAVGNHGIGKNTFFEVLGTRVAGEEGKYVVGVWFGETPVTLHVTVTADSYDVTKGVYDVSSARSVYDACIVMFEPGSLTSFRSIKKWQDLATKNDLPFVTCGLRSDLRWVVNPTVVENYVMTSAKYNKNLLLPFQKLFGRDLGCIEHVFAPTIAPFKDVYEIQHNIDKTYPAEKLMQDIGY